MNLNSEKYRFYFARNWGGVCFILLNPSFADDAKSDPTTKRCRELTEKLGHRSFEIVNLFVTRGGSSKDFVKFKTGEKKAEKKQWLKNDKIILAAVERAAIVIVGWGDTAREIENGVRAKKVCVKLEKFGDKVFALGFTKSGSPKHPKPSGGQKEPQLPLKNFDFKNYYLKLKT